MILVNWLLILHVQLGPDILTHIVSGMPVHLIDVKAVTIQFVFETWMYIDCFVFSTMQNHFTMIQLGCLSSLAQ